MLTFEQYINEQRIDELSSDLLKRAAIAAKNRNAGKVDARTRRFEKAAIDALKREIAQSDRQRRRSNDRLLGIFKIGNYENMAI